MCNILNQNPAFHATSTQETPFILRSIANAWKNSFNIKNELNLDREGTEDRMRRTLRAYLSTWHEKTQADVIFDKSRGWSNNILMLQELFPEAVAIVMVRDLRLCMASIEKQHQQFPVLDDANEPVGQTIIGKADEAMHPTQGIIGSSVVGVEDIIRRSHKNIVYVQCESLQADPESVMRGVYEAIGEVYFPHNFKKVKNTAIDPDGFYMYKYPHEGAGEVKPSDPEEWRKFLSPDIAAGIQNRYPFYNHAFGYDTTEPVRQSSGLRLAGKKSPVRVTLQNQGCQK
jgi:sulfotransferase